MYYYGHVDSQPLGEEGIQVILQWKEKSMTRAFNSLLSLQCRNSFEHIRHPAQVEHRTIQEDFEEIVKESPAYVLDMAKRRLKRKRETKGSQRAEVENEQRQVYALQLAEIIKEAVLPVTVQIDLLQDPNRAWVRIFGSRRSKTLRNRLKAWQRFSQLVLGLFWGSLAQKYHTFSCIR